MAEAFSGLRFERRRPRLPRRPVAICGGLCLFTLLWIIVPTRALYWLLLPLLAALVWMASYGWRSALSTLLELLHRLERM